MSQIAGGDSFNAAERATGRYIRRRAIQRGAEYLGIRPHTRLGDLQSRVEDSVMNAVGQRANARVRGNIRRRGQRMTDRFNQSRLGRSMGGYAPNPFRDIDSWSSEQVPAVGQQDRDANGSDRGLQGIMFH